MHGHGHMHGGHAHTHSHDHGSIHDHSHQHGDHFHDESEHDTVDPEEEHRATVIATFETYFRHTSQHLQRRREAFFALPQRHRQLIGPTYTSLLSEASGCLRHNGELLRKMVSVDAFGESTEGAYSARAPEPDDYGRVNATLRQIVRDWTAEGQEERMCAYGPIIRAIEEAYPEKGKSILVPGAGLGRLPWELALRGYDAQGNDYSLYMIIASNYIINHTSEGNKVHLYPFANAFSNHKHASDILKRYEAPNVDPQSIMGRGTFSFGAGDFVESYMNEENREAWDCVATCFFLDTAKNICAYLETIQHVLKPGGLWVNLGPNLWHYEYDESIDLPLSDVIQVAQRVGFEIQEQRTCASPYASDPTSLLQHRYACEFWTAKKGAQ